MEMPPVGASAAVTMEVTLMFGWIWTIIVGAFIGWIASLSRKTEVDTAAEVPARLNNKADVIYAQTAVKGWEAKNADEKALSDDRSRR